MFYLLSMLSQLCKFLLNNSRADSANRTSFLLSDYAQNLSSTAAKMRCREQDVVLTVQDSELEGDEIKARVT